jgi:osmotically-inducible protein OsmY
MGWVTLKGVVDHAYQREEVERMVRHVRGVTGVTNGIEVTASGAAEETEKRIAEMLRRQADLDARSIRVEVSDHTAHLYGHVHSVHEAEAARRAAESAPGVVRVESDLAVLP